MALGLSIANLMYLLTTMPMEKGVDNWIEIINEVLVYLCGINLLLFTQFVADPNDRWDIGYVYMTIAIILIAINILSFTFNEGKAGIAYLKLEYTKWKAKKKDSKQSKNKLTSEQLT